MNPEAAVPIETELAEPGLLSDFVTITKARLSLLVVFTTFLGVPWQNNIRWICSVWW